MRHGMSLMMSPRKFAHCGKHTCALAIIRIDSFPLLRNFAKNEPHLEPLMDRIACN